MGDNNLPWAALLQLYQWNPVQSQFTSGLLARMGICLLHLSTESVGRLSKIKILAGDFDGYALCYHSAQLKPLQWGAAKVGVTQLSYLYHSGQGLAQDPCRGPWQLLLKVWEPKGSKALWKHCKPQHSHSVPAHNGSSMQLHYLHPSKPHMCHR